MSLWQRSGSALRRGEASDPLRESGHLVPEHEPVRQEVADGRAQPRRVVVQPIERAEREPEQGAEKRGESHGHIW